MSLVEKIADAVLAAGLVVADAEPHQHGPGLDPATEMGPLANAAQLATVTGFIERAREQGASMPYGGPNAELGGLFVSPIGWVITPIVMLVVSFFGYVLPVLVSQQATMDNVFSLVAFLLILPIVPLTTVIDRTMPGV